MKAARVSWVSLLRLLPWAFISSNFAPGTVPEAEAGDGSVAAVLGGGVVDVEEAAGPAAPAAHSCSLSRDSKIEYLF